MKEMLRNDKSPTKFKLKTIALIIIVLLSHLPPTSAQETSMNRTATEAIVEPAAQEFDEFGNVVIKKRVYTDKELAEMQSIYPKEPVFTEE
jgi:hypothetical protein